VTSIATTKDFQAVGLKNLYCFWMGY